MSHTSSTMPRVTKGRAWSKRFGSTARTAVQPGLGSEVRGGAVELVDIVEELPGAVGHGGERVVRDDDGQAGLFGKELVDAADERAAAGHDKAAVHQVGGKLGRAALERGADGLDDGADGVTDGLADFLGGDVDGLEQAGDRVAALDLHRQLGLERVGGADGDLDLLRRALADEEVVGPLHVIDDGEVDLVARDADGLGKHDAVQRNDGDLRGAAADMIVDIGGGLGPPQAAAAGGGHGLEDGDDLAGAGVRGGFLHGALLDLGDAARNGDDDAGRHDLGIVVHLLDEVAEHRLGDVEVGDDAVLHRADGGDVAGGAP